MKTFMLKVSFLICMMQELLSGGDSCIQGATAPPSQPPTGFMTIQILKSQQGWLTSIIAAATGLPLHTKERHRKPDQGGAEVVLGEVVKGRNESAEWKIRKPNLSQLCQAFFPFTQVARKARIHEARLVFQLSCSIFLNETSGFMKWGAASCHYAALQRLCMQHEGSRSEGEEEFDDSGEEVWWDAHGVRLQPEQIVPPFQQRRRFLHWLWLWFWFSFRWSGNDTPGGFQQVTCEIGWIIDSFGK